MLHEVLIALITVLALALTAASALSYRRSGNRKVLMVTLAFALFFAKGLVLTIGIFMWKADFAALLLYSAAFDFAILVLLFGSLVLRKG